MGRLILRGIGPGVYVYSNIRQFNFTLVTILHCQSLSEGAESPIRTTATASSIMGLENLANTRPGFDISEIRKVTVDPFETNGRSFFNHGKISEMDSVEVPSH